MAVGELRESGDFGVPGVHAELYAVKECIVPIQVPDTYWENDLKCD